MPKRDLLTDERIDHPTQHRVFRFGALPGLLARFGIGNEFRFADKFKIDGQRNVLAVGQSRQQVDSLNVPILGMVEVSADQFVRVGAGFSFHAVIKSSKIRQPSLDCIVRMCGLTTFHRSLLSNSFWERKRVTWSWLTTWGRSAASPVAVVCPKEMSR